MTRKRTGALELAIAAVAVTICATATIAVAQSAGAPSPQQPAAEVAGLPALTQAQMLEDFDALVKIVREVMPTAAANKAVYGFDVFENLARYRAKIPTLRSTVEFVLLLDGAINSSRGSHFDADTTTVADFRAQESLRRYIDGYVTEAALEKQEKYIASIKQARQGSALNIPLLYLDGAYYVRHDFVSEGKTYPRGSQVVSCNGRSPHDIVRANADATAMLPFDFASRQFYSTTFPTYPDVARDGVVSCVFRTPAGESATGQFRANEKVVFQAPARTTGKEVAYLEKSAVLYVRVPSMNPGDIAFYKSGIAERGYGRNVRAAVIDIRGNGGGSDNVWTEILKSLLASEVKFRMAIGIRNTELARRYVARHGMDFAKNAEVRQVPFLGNGEFAVLESDRTITPAPDSLGVPTIFVLTNRVFSAAGSLTTVAGLAEPIVSVGTRNPYILGRGIDPLHFSLPHSGFTFRIEPVVDLTGASKAEDVFHTGVEVELRSTLTEMLAFYNEKQENLEDFLTTHDPFFRKTLELLTKKRD